MNISRVLFLSFTVALGSLVASAQQVAAEAFVSSVVGSATVTLPGSTQPVPAVAGQKLPEGALVETAADSKVLIQSHEGIATGLGANTSAAVGAHSVSAEGVRTAVIDLKKGTTVSALDPSKRAINNYAVRTPKGVAAARGTVYSTTVTLASGGQATVTVNTITGDVSFSIVGGPTVSVAEGRSANSRSNAVTSIAEATANVASETEKQAIVEALQTTVTVVAALTQAQGSISGNQPLALMTVVENVTKAANEIAKTDPATASTIVTQTVDAVQTYANPGGTTNSALAMIQRSAEGQVAEAAQQARATPETPVAVTVVQTPPTGPGPTPPPTIIIPTPDTPGPDITISPSS